MRLTVGSKLNHTQTEKETVKFTQNWKQSCCHASYQ